MAWVRDQWYAGAELLHARPILPDGRRRVSWLRPSAPALILGSASPDPFSTTPDASAQGRVAGRVGEPAARNPVGGHPAAAGIPRVRRRSGGGLVWLDPELSTWVDVFVPVEDPLWRADVGEAFYWLGRTLAAAFCDLGLAASMHCSPYEAGPSDGLVCFASRGPGEVVVDGKKLVGISQRRTRDGCRFQCIAYERFELGPLASAVDSLTAFRVRERAVGWAELGIGASPPNIAEVLVSYICAHDI